MKKRILSIVLSLCMVMAFMPQMAFAEGAGNLYTFIEGTTVDNQNEVAAKLIDGTSATKWCVTNFGRAYIIFKTSTAVTVSGYSITTGNDNERNKGRNPKNWTLYGCNDESAGRNSASWIPIHSVTNDTVLKDENYTTYNFAFDKTETPYQCYKLEITAIQSGDVMQMSEFSLTDCDHNWGTTESEAPTCMSSGYTKRTCNICKGTDTVYLKSTDHDFTGEGGKCTTCGYTADKLYVDENGMSCPVNGNTTEITEGLTAWNNTDANSGWYIVKSNVTLNSVTVSGNVHLVLADGCNLKVNGDITEGRLTIYGQSGGTGTLDVTGRITGGYGEGRTGVGGGNITIKGGVVKAESITGGTGGDGFVVEGQPDPTFYNGSVGGDITISGGVVEAGSITGGKGGNSQGGTGGRGGNITISGGVVKAESITGGIGGIDPGDGCGGGSVAITGGVVDATSITGGYGNGSIGKDGSVDITGGIVFQSDDGQVYGTDVTLSKSFTISEGKTLTIGSDNNLIIPDGVILANNGTINNNGTITNNGKIYVDGTFTGTADNLYYPLTIVDATASGDTSEHNSKNYGKAGSTISLTPYALSTGYKFCGWDVSPANTVTMVGDNTYTITMPREALTITAQYKDITVPVILGIENGKTYCAAVEFEVSDNDGIASVKTGNEILTVGSNGKYTLASGVGTVTVVATDDTGNTAKVTVTVNNGHTYEWQDDNGQYWKKCQYCGDETAKKEIPTVTINGADSVCVTQDYKFSFTLPEGATDASYGYEFENKGDEYLKPTVENGKMVAVIPADIYEPNEDSFKIITSAKTADGFEFFVSKTVALKSEHTDAAPKDHICDICGATLSEHSGGEATCTNKAVCEYCGEEYGELDSSNHNLENISAKAASVTETGNKEYWHCLDCGKYSADENGTNEIKLDDTVTQKLPPEIIEGKGQSITAGEKKELIFRSNAAFGDFIRAQLDGKALDERYYTVKEGSTIVTLKADYVATLSAGEHTIGIVSESGTATTTFTVNAKAENNNNSPQTGDNSHMALWIALLFVSGGLLIGTGVYGKKKKYRR